MFDAAFVHGLDDVFAVRVGPPDDDEEWADDAPEDVELRTIQPEARA
jgi:hypothetical protein